MTQVHDVLAPHTTDLAGATALVVGASRGFGRGLATELVARGVRVIGVARNQGPLDAVREALGEAFTPVVGDATTPGLAEDLISAHQPQLLALVAGAIPVIGPMQEHTWESFSTNWDADVQLVFRWLSAALRAPLAPGGQVISFSSGSALKGSPLSAGYAGANATIRFISSYAQMESDGAGLGLRFTAVLPQLSPATDLGMTGVAAYAGRNRIDVDEFVAAMPHVLTPELVGAAVADILSDARANRPAAYRILESGQAEPLV